MLGAIISDHKNLNGTCPTGGEHDGTYSGKYIMRINEVANNAFQDGWSFCFKCKALYYSGGGISANCAAGGVHNNNGSGQYSVLHKASN